MSSMADRDSDSDGAPEELTFEQGVKKDEEIKGLQRENKARGTSLCRVDGPQLAYAPYDLYQVPPPLPPPSSSSKVSTAPLDIDDHVLSDAYGFPIDPLEENDLDLSIVIRKVPRSCQISSCRVAREKRERRRLWAQRRMKREPPTEVAPKLVVDDDQHMRDVPGMLPKDVVTFLTSREKRVFSSESEPEKETVERESVSRKRNQKKSGTSAVLLKDLPPPKCTENSLDFLKKRKARVARSRAVLTNADQALRLLASRGSLLSRS